MATTTHSDVTERRQIPDRRSMPARCLSSLDWLALAMLVIGGLNFGALGLFGIDPVAALFSEGSVLARFLYLLIGWSAVHASLYTANKLARRHG